MNTNMKIVINGVSSRSNAQPSQAPSGIRKTIMVAPNSGGGERVLARSKPVSALAFLLATTLFIASSVMAHDEGVTRLMSNDLEQVSGKEVLMYTVDFP